MKTNAKVLLAQTNYNIKFKYFSEKMFGEILKQKKLLVVHVVKLIVIANKLT